MRVRTQAHTCVCSHTNIYNVGVHHSSVTPSVLYLVVQIDDVHPKNELKFELSTVVIVAGIIGGTIVLAVAVIVCGVVYIQKYK